MAIVQEFMYESDNKKEFLEVVKRMLPILFPCGNNEKPQYHNMYYDLGENPRYWTLMDDKDGKKVPKRMSMICLSHHLSDTHAISKNEYKVPMEFKLNKDKTTWNEHNLIWKKKSYKILTDTIEKVISIDEKEFRKIFPVNGWIKKESSISGSNDISYKMQWQESNPGALYISMGYMYFGQ